MNSSNYKMLANICMKIINKVALRTLLAMIALLISNLIYSQTSGGINFQKFISWELLLNEAKKHNKYIFVDCFATWCRPCLAMDREVFPLQNVGRYFNENFISIKLQMDTSVKDNDHIKSVYEETHHLRVKYEIFAYPTYLFFSPEGKLVHRAAGGYDENGFLSIARDALNPGKQYFKLFEDYIGGERSTGVLKHLARAAKSMNDTELANKISEEFYAKLDYIDLKEAENIFFLKEFNEGSQAHRVFSKSIKRLTKSDVFKRDIIEVLALFAKKSTDPSFKILYQNSRRINQIMAIDFYCEAFIESVIKKEIADAIVFPDKKASTIEPNWKTLNKTIAKKYSVDYANRIVLSSRWQWYSAKAMWKKANKYEVLYINKYGQNIPIFWKNNLAWDIFRRSSDKAELQSALSWVDPDKAIAEKLYNVLDTYANLLYKLGQIEDALKWQQIAVAGSPSDAGLSENYRKMKLGLPTWPQE